MTAPSSTRARLTLLVLGCTLAACAESATTARPAPRAIPPGFGELTPLQQRLMERPASPEAIAGRPATRADLERMVSGMAPGEMDTLIRITNRRAVARGADTLPHCFPLCGVPDPER